MTSHPVRRAYSPLQHTVLNILLASGRAMTVNELRTQLQDGAFGDLPIEPINRVLVALRRRGQVRRVAQCGQKRAHWASVTSPVIDLSGGAGFSGEALQRNSFHGASDDSSLSGMQRDSARQWLGGAA